MKKKNEGSRLVDGLMKQISKKMPHFVQP